MKKGLISNFRGVAELGLAAQGTRVGTGKCSKATLKYLGSTALTPWCRFLATPLAYLSCA
jgi:hypothetical protein